MVHWNFYWFFIFIFVDCYGYQPSWCSFEYWLFKTNSL